MSGDIYYFDQPTSVHEISGLIWSNLLATVTQPDSFIGRDFMITVWPQ